MSHGSSLTAELLGDVGTFTAVSEVLKDSEEWGVPLHLRPLLLGDNGKEDSLLWKEMDGGLSKPATMEKEIMGPVRGLGSITFWQKYIMSD